MARVALTQRAADAIEFRVVDRDRVEDQDAAERGLFIVSLLVVPDCVAPRFVSARFSAIVVVYHPYFYPPEPLGVPRVVEFADSAELVRFGGPVRVIGCIERSPRLATTQVNRGRRVPSCVHEQRTWQT